MAQRNPSDDHLSVFQVVAWNVFVLRTNRYPRMSRRRLSELSGVSHRSLDELEQLRDPDREPPRQGVSIGIVGRLADALGVPVSELFSDARAKDAATRVHLQGSPPSLQVIPGRGRARDQRALPFLEPVRRSL
jgi:transcriptional regulator with XRE-family HTH domain